MNNLMQNKKINLLGTTFQQLLNIFIENNLTAIEAKQVFLWIHNKCINDFQNMSNVSIKTREFLTQYFSLERGNCISLQKSSDGTQKALLKLNDNCKIETVLIPDKNRNTICVSSQVGCAMGCKFCYTGFQNFTRNLTASEIMMQVLFWKDNMKNSETRLSNIVFMGMGEPLLNHENLCVTLELLLNEKCHNFSRQKIVVSTSGIIDNNAMKNIAKFGVRLAFSLHAPNDAIRTEIMPINKKYNIKKLLDAAKNYIKNSNTEYITFEYLLLKNINDLKKHALELVELLKNIPCKINLIVFNDWPETDLKGSDKNTANEFLKILLANNIRSTIRKSRGDDILAACGQLNASEKLNKIEGITS